MAQPPAVGKLRDKINWIRMLPSNAGDVSWSYSLYCINQVEELCYHHLCGPIHRERERNREIEIDSSQDSYDVT